MLGEFFRRYLKFLWLTPALLLWGSFPPLAEKTDILFALAPLMYLTRHSGRRDPKGVALVWFVNGLTFYLATLSWMPAIVKNGGPWPLVALGMGALSTYCALYFAAYGYVATCVWDWVRSRNYAWRLAAIIVVEPLLWAGLEIVRSRFGGGFAWNQLGTVAVNAGFGAPASLGGVYLLSMLIVLINGTLVGIAERVFRKGGTSLETILPLIFVFGTFELAKWTTPQPSESVGEGETMKVALVQRNFPCVFNPEREENPQLVYSNLLSKVALLAPELVVLPESAMAEFGRLDRHNAFRFAEWVRELTGAEAVIAGGTRVEQSKVYNSAGMFQEERVDFYDKVHLVPFGEYIPGDKLIPALQKLAPVGSCTAGDLKLLGNFGVAICYEDTDSAQMRRLAKMGAKALVFITNDSWFSYSEEPVQHAWQAVARAIETGLAVVRVGNSGVSGTIAPDGSATWLVDGKGRMLLDTPGTMFDRVILAQTSAPGGLTWYVRLGDKPIFIAFLLLMAAIFMVKYKRTLEIIRLRRRYGSDE